MVLYLLGQPSLCFTAISGANRKQDQQTAAGEDHADKKSRPATKTKKGTKKNTGSGGLKGFVVHFSVNIDMGDWTLNARGLADGDWEPWQIKPVEKDFFKAVKEVKKEDVKGHIPTGFATIEEAEAAALAKITELQAQHERPAADYLASHQDPEPVKQTRSLTKDSNLPLLTMMANPKLPEYVQQRLDEGEITNWGDERPQLIIKAWVEVA